MSERWLPCVGFPDYEVSDEGRVRRVTAQMRATVGKVLRPGSSRYNHKFLILRLNGKSYRRFVSALVMAAFVGPRPTGNDVNHKDFDPSNNRLGNLEYLTHADNNRYSARAGRIKPPVKRGEQSNGAKLTEAQVREIRRLYAAGSTSAPKLGRQFGVAHSSILNIVHRRVWKHVD